MIRIAAVLFVSGLACSRSEVPDSGVPPTKSPAQPGEPVVQSTPATPGPATPQPATPGPFAADDRAAVIAAYASATGQKLDDADCVTWSPTFPRVVAVGSFAYDYGCEGAGIFVDRQFHAEGGEVAGLATRGFVGATPAEKQALARSWVDEVVQTSDGDFVAQASTAFELPGVPKFVAPAAASAPAPASTPSGVVVTGWVRAPSGKVDRQTFNFMAYTFAPDGRMTVESRQNFSVDGSKVRERESKGR